MKCEGCKKDLIEKDQFKVTNAELGTEIYCEECFKKWIYNTGRTQ